MSVLEASFKRMSMFTVQEHSDSNDEGQIEIEEPGDEYLDTMSSQSQQVLLPATSLDCETVDEDKIRVRKKAYAVLEQVDNLVEKLRMDAIRIEDDKESILSSLDSLKNSSELHFLPEGEYREILSYMNVLVSRLLTIEIRVNTHRSRLQEEALHRVNGCIDQLVLKFQENPMQTKTACIGYLKACDDGVDTDDLNFAPALAECSSDDRKRIRRRLQGLLGYMESCQKSVQLEILE